MWVCLKEMCCGMNVMWIRTHLVSVCPAGAPHSGSFRCDPLWGCAQSHVLCGQCQSGGTLLSGRESNKQRGSSPVDAGSHLPLCGFGYVCCQNLLWLVKLIHSSVLCCCFVVARVPTDLFYVLVQCYFLWKEITLYLITYTFSKGDHITHDHVCKIKKKQM